MNEPETDRTRSGCLAGGGEWKWIDSKSCPKPKGTSAKATKKKGKRRDQDHTFMRDGGKESRAKAKAKLQSYASNYCYLTSKHVRALRREKK